MPLLVSHVCVQLATMVYNVKRLTIAVNPNLVKMAAVASTLLLATLACVVSDISVSTVRLCTIAVNPNLVKMVAVAATALLALRVRA